MFSHCLQYGSGDMTEANQLQARCVQIQGHRWSDRLCHCRPFVSEGKGLMSVHCDVYVGRGLSSSDLYRHLRVFHDLISWQLHRDLPISSSIFCHSSPFFRATQLRVLQAAEALGSVPPVAASRLQRTTSSPVLAFPGGMLGAALRAWSTLPASCCLHLGLLSVDGCPRH